MCCGHRSSFFRDLFKSSPSAVVELLAAVQPRSLQQIDPHSVLYGPAEHEHGGPVPAHLHSLQIQEALEKGTEFFSKLALQVATPRAYTWRRPRPQSFGVP